MTNDERPRPLIAQLAAVPEVGTEYRPFSISPDGATIAFEWRQDGDWQIFTVDAHGATSPKHLVAIDDPCGCPTYSADGRYLYFSRDDRGSECFDFYRYELATGELENLLPDTPALAPSPDLRLSPDGTRIALSVNRLQGYAAALMPATPCTGGGGIEVIAEHSFNDWTPHWSPDGTHVAWHTDTHGQDSAVFVAAVGESGAPIIASDVRAIGGDDPALAWHPRWSPDGGRIAFTGVVDERYAIGVYDVAADRIDWAWAGDRDASRPVWSPDGQALVFVTEHEAETALWRLDLQTKAIRDLSIGRGNHYHPRFTPDGTALIVVLSSPGVPCDLFRVELADGRSTRLTNGLPDALAGHDFVNGEHIHYRSLDTIADVPALLFRPRRHNGAGVVIIHGGPTWHHSNEWDPLRDAFLDAGCMVAHPNYRGSDGYGRRWQLANRYLVGEGEIQDTAGAHALLVEMGCDPRRIACTGRSWGGFQTMALLTRFPKLWACGVAGVPFFDFIFAQRDPAVREDLVWWDRENSGDLTADRARLEYVSPINHLDRIAAPVLLLAAALDPRCPPGQIDEARERIRARGIECDSHIYPDEGHEISGIENRIDYDRRTVEYILARIC
jgi:dipeptidyl aminopeptidase/acylaminoacyl peptidase